MGCVLLALGSTLLSVVRAHKADFGKTAMEVLRPQDRMLIKMSESARESLPVSLDFFDAAFADFVVDVVNNDSVFVIDYGGQRK